MENREILQPKEYSKPKSLKELFEIITDIYPESDLNIEEFITETIAYLSTHDANRNKWLTGQVSALGKQLNFQDHWPLNDFWYSARDFLTKKGLDPSKLNTIVSRYSL